ncbi:hypothetical protein RYH72_003059 [Pseudomonas syringae pv. actinidiae]|uniref:Lar family restriction alleviation protein n=1 Tax=Pseudomonas syringae TaxID=317 RepID=UPI002934EDA8|nr:Lar family restriction alleviation protein [Pseudomonas syringae]
MSNTPDSTELLPCSFCGQQDAFVEQLDSDASVVICQGLVGEHAACLARGPVGLREHELEDQPGRNAAVREWNRRAQPADLHAPFPGYPPVPDDRKLPADQQGEPVAYWADAYGNTIQADHKSHNLRVGGTPAMVVERYITPLYAQPATAKVVLPERLDLPHRDEFESADQHAAAVGEAKTWNACLDEVAKLNTPQ